MKLFRATGSILLYVMLLINVALVVGIVVYNNSYVIVNNIDIGNNQEEVFANIYDKGHIAIDSVIKYNSNGEGFLDGISCPQNITMSGSVTRQTSITSSLIYEYGKVHCLGTYNGNDFKIFYDDEVNDFTSAQYQGDIVNIIRGAGTDINVSTSNIASSTTATATTAWWGTPSETIDGLLSTGFDSYYKSSNEYINYEFPGSERSIGKIVIKKPYHRNGSSGYWNSGKLYFYNASGTEVERINLSGMRRKTYHEIDLKYRGLTADVKDIRLSVSNKYLDIFEFEIYELTTAGSEGWEGDRVFTDGDSTFMSFDKTGIEGNDGIDDDLNSDNYKVTSIGNTYFPNGYQDDDVVPRKTVFGSIPPNTDYQHSFWNNYKTLDVVENNVNNNDILNVKIGDVNDGHVFINTFNTHDLDYNIKIIEFDRDVYKDQYTLLPLNSYEGRNIDTYLGYIQYNSGSGSLGVAKEKTGNEFVFDFQNKDYAIFLANNSDALLSYHLEAYNASGSGIYINPIDDSGTGTVSVLANHIIIGGEKNFIGENFEVVGSK